MKLRLDYGPEQAQKIQEGEFTAVDILVIIWTTVRKLKDKTSIILWSSFILLALWGFHGDMAILTRVFGKGWTEKVTFGLPWGKQLISFVVGFLLLVVIPCLIIKFVFKENITDYGLGLPPPDQRHKARVAFLWLTGIAMIFVFLASLDKSMQQAYPFFVQRSPDGQVTWTITRWWEFLLYELIYVLFFITIEFSFRGYLLFGLSSIQITQKLDGNRWISIPRFGIYAILIQMLAYTTWHHGKPVPELVGTLVWGICTAAIALRIRSIWPIIMSHWVYNVFLDWLLWVRFPLVPGG